MGKHLKYVAEFEFPSDKGYSASAGKTMVKGYARGGAADIKQDKAMVKAAVQKHERARHPGEPMTKLARGGMAECAMAKGGMAMRKQYPTNRAEPMITRTKAAAAPAPKSDMLYSKKEVNAKNLLSEGKAPSLPHAKGSVNMKSGGPVKKADGGRITHMGPGSGNAPPAAGLPRMGRPGAGSGNTGAVRPPVTNPGRPMPAPPGGGRPSPAGNRPMPDGPLVETRGGGRPMPAPPGGGRPGDRDPRVLSPSQANWGASNPDSPYLPNDAPNPSYKGPPVSQRGGRQMAAPPAMAKGGMTPKQQAKVGKVMGEFKAGELHSGKDGPVVKNRKQAIAIGLSEARKAKK